MIAERAHETGRSYVLRDDDGKFLCSLTFRALLALVAVREGKAFARVKLRYSYGLVDEHLEPRCDFYGIGYGTLSELQRDDWTFTALVTRPAEPGTLALTPFGGEVLAAVLALPGVSAEPMAAMA